VSPKASSIFNANATPVPPKELLAQFEKEQAMHVADRDRLIEELGAS